MAAALTLVLGISLGLALLLRRELWGRWPSPYLVSAHVHLVMVGTVLQVIAGVALWMFPRPLKDDPRHREGYAVAAWWLLTPGTLLRAAAEAARGLTASPAWVWPVVLGAVMQVLALVLLLLALRTRIRLGGAAKAVGSQRPTPR